MSRQCPSCGGFCKPSGCERANVEVKMADEQPALYQRRMKPLFDYKFPWSAWEECSKEVFHQYERQQVWGDYVYEARKLYEHPTPAVDADPVAWMYDFLNPENRDEVVRNWVTQDHADIEREKGFNVRPLYTRPAPAVVRQLVEALQMVLDDPDALDGRPRTYECVQEALAAVKEAGL